MKKILILGVRGVPASHGGFETFAEYRRTGVPALTPAVEGAISTIPTRLFYPSTQVSLNKDNYEAAKGMLNNGDNLDSKLFWTL